MSANRDLALRCWETVKEALDQVGQSINGLIVHHDQDTVYTSYDWLQALLIRDWARVSFAEHGAEGTPLTESLWCWFKENESLLSEAATLGELPVSDRAVDTVLQHRAQALGAVMPQK